MTPLPAGPVPCRREVRPCLRRGLERGPDLGGRTPFALLLSPRHGIRAGDPIPTATKLRGCLLPSVSPSFLSLSLFSSFASGGPPLVPLSPPHPPVSDALSSRLVSPPVPTSAAPRRPPPRTQSAVPTLPVLETGPTASTTTGPTLYLAHPGAVRRVTHTLGLFGPSQNSPRGMGNDGLGHGVAPPPVSKLLQYPHRHRVPYLSQALPRPTLRPCTRRDR